MMKQLLASVKFLYLEVLKKPINFDFNIKMKKQSTIPEVFFGWESSTIPKLFQKPET